ncbi:MAG: HAMP domain-containing histidine kinase [Oscillospiraceae bacterium]|nr:HAMP domain-containing histidine kinase [Oscillospiraceae bacterium]
MPRSRKSGAKPAKGLKFSLVRQLNIRQFVRLLLTFVGLDLLLVALVCAGLLVWSEARCAAVFGLIETNGLPTQESAAWMEAGEYTVAELDRAPSGVALPDIPLPGEVTPGLRSIQLPNVISIFRLSALRPGMGAEYTVEFDYGPSAYAITIHLEWGATVFIWMMRVLLLVELIMLACYPFRNAKAIGRVLRPIQDFAAAANKITTAPGLSPEAIKTLTATLGEINESHLDTRISLPEGQSELQVLGASINAMLERLDSGFSAQMRFVSDASHELRTPIAVIQGYASLLNRWGKDNPETRQEAIDAIQAEASAMKSLVEQLLFLVRGDNESMQLHVTRFALHEMVGEVLRASEVIDENHIFIAQLEEVVISGDNGLLKQALRILVDNSIKYTPPGGTITLTVTMDGRNARIAVQDEGQGMEAEAIPHIFDRFYRTDESRARQTGGTGLGLSIAKWIVDRHGGWFEVLSWKGVGTRMTIVLPQTIEPPPSTTSP